MRRSTPFWSRHVRLRVMTPRLRLQNLHLTLLVRSSPVRVGHRRTATPWAALTCPTPGFSGGAGSSGGVNKRRRAGRRGLIGGPFGGRRGGDGGPIFEREDRRRPPGAHRSIAGRTRL